MRAFFLFPLFLSLISCAQRIDEVEARLEDLDERSRILESRSGLPVGSDRELLEGRRLADVRSQISTMRNDITVMKGQMEILEYNNQALTEQLDALSARLDRRASSAQEAPRRSREAGSGKPAELYRQAMRAHQAGNFEESRALFLRYMEEFPEDLLADNALFWVAEGHRLQGQHREALLRYQDLIEKYPQSDKKCEAMSRQVDAFRNLGMASEADTYAQILAEECPDQN